MVITYKVFTTMISFIWASDTLLTSREALVMSWYREALVMIWYTKALDMLLASLEKFGLPPAP